MTQNRDTDILELRSDLAKIRLTILALKLEKNGKDLEELGSEIQDELGSIEQAENELTDIKRKIEALAVKAKGL